MEILEKVEIKLSWDDTKNLATHPEPNYERSKGIHLGEIIHQAAIDTNQLRDEDREEDMPLRVFLGLAWEAMCVRLYPWINWQPGELERDGIYGSPDGMWMALGGVEGVDEPVAIWECKQTTKRIQGISELWMYLRQGMAYCAQSGLRHVLYDICFLLGDYQRPYQPKGMICLVEFTDMEVDRFCCRDSVHARFKSAAASFGVVGVQRCFRHWLPFPMVECWLVDVELRR